MAAEKPGRASTRRDGNRAVQPPVAAGKTASAGESSPARLFSSKRMEKGNRLETTIERRERHAAAFEEVYGKVLVVILTAYTSYLLGVQ